MQLLLRFESNFVFSDNQHAHVFCWFAAGRTNVVFVFFGKTTNILVSAMRTCYQFVAILCQQLYPLQLRRSFVFSVAKPVYKSAMKCLFDIQRYNFSFDNTTIYKYYKFEFTARKGGIDSGDSLMQLSEIKMTANVDTSQAALKNRYYVKDKDKWVGAWCDNNYNNGSEVGDQRAVTVEFLPIVEGLVVNGFAFHLKDVPTDVEAEKSLLDSIKVEILRVGTASTTTLNIKSRTISENKKVYTVTLDNSSAHEGHKYKFKTPTGSANSNANRPQGSQKIAEMDILYRFACDHVWKGNFSERVEPTCTQTGARKYRTCAGGCGACQYYADNGDLLVCEIEGFEDHVVIAPSSHSYGAWTEATTATCVAEGNRKYHVCTLGCNTHQYYDEAGTLQLCTLQEFAPKIKIAKNDDHSFPDTWIEAAAATCTSDGNRKYQACSRGCGTYNYYDEKNTVQRCTQQEFDAKIKLSATGHGYGDWHEPKNPTCTEQGTYAWRRCYNHNNSCLQYQYMPDLTRTDYETNQTGALTCDKFSFDDIRVEPTGHSYGDWTNAVTPDCIHEGNNKYRKCSACKGYEYVVGDDTLTCTENQFDSKVKLAATNRHTYGRWFAANAPSCQEEGNYAYRKCFVCNAYMYIPDLTKTDYEANPSGALICQETAFDTTVKLAANGHNYGSWTDAVAADCVTSGNYQHRQCSACNGYEYIANGNTLTCTESQFDTNIKIAALNHDFPDSGVYNGTNDTQHWQDCRRQGCSVTQGQQNHRYATSCTIACTECGFERDQSLLVHKFDGQPYNLDTTDNTKHCRSCANSGCTNVERTAHDWETDVIYAEINGEHRHYNKCRHCQYEDQANATVCTLAWTSDETNMEHVKWCQSGEHFVESTRQNHNWAVMFRQDLADSGQGNFHDQYCTVCNVWKNDPMQCNIDSEWKMNAKEHWHICKVCKNEFDKEQHTPIMLWDGTEHWHDCSKCDKLLDNYTEHTFETETSTTCTNTECSYKRYLGVTVQMDGYKTNGLLREFTASATTTNSDVTAVIDDIEIFNADFDEIRFEEGKTDYNATFQPNTTYYATLYFDCGNYYPAWDLTAKDFILPEGMFFSQYNWDEDSHSDGTTSVILELYVMLAPLGGVSTAETISAVEITIDGFAIDATASQVNVSTNKENIKVKSTRLYWLSGSRLDDDTVITDDELIYIKVKLTAPEGHTFFGITQESVTVTNNIGTVYYISVSNGGCMLTVEIDMDSFVKEHECVYSEIGYVEEEENVATKHALFCPTCWDYVEEDHAYDDKFDVECNKCKYERHVVLEEMFITLSGFNIDGKIKEIKSSVPTNEYEIATTTQVYIIDVEYMMPIMSDTARFLPGEQYYLMIELSVPTIVDASKVMLNNVYVNGIETAVFTSSKSTWGGTTYELNYVLALTPLTGKTSQKMLTDVDVEISGIDIGNTLADVQSSLKFTGVIERLSNVMFYCDGQTMYDEDTFQLGKQYTVVVLLAIADGYHAVGMGEGDVTVGNFKQIGEPITFHNNLSSHSASYVAYAFMISFEMDEQHQHVFTGESVDYFYDEIGHAVACQCGALGEFVAHVYTDDLSKCDVCGYTRKIPVQQIVLTLDGYDVGMHADMVFDGIDYDKDFNIQGLGLYKNIDLNNFSAIINDDDYVEIVTPNQKISMVAVVVVDLNDFDISTLTDNDIILRGAGSTDIVPSMMITYKFGTDAMIGVIFDMPVLQSVHIHGGTWVDKVDETCTTDGTKAHYECTICHKNFDGDNKELTEVTIPASHKFGEWQNQVTATCTADGTKAHKTCSDCGKHFDSEDKQIDNLVLSATGHKWDNGTVTTSATCTQKGVKTFFCKHDNCNETKTEDVAATGHSYADQHTCHNRACTNCGEVLAASTNHTWNNGTVEVEPTKDSVGKMTFTCSQCGDKRSEEIPALNKSGCKSVISTSSATIAIGVVLATACAVIVRKKRFD